MSFAIIITVMCMHVFVIACTCILLYLCWSMDDTCTCICSYALPLRHFDQLIGDLARKQWSSEEAASRPKS